MADIPWHAGLLLARDDESGRLDAETTLPRLSTPGQMLIKFTLWLCVVAIAGLGVYMLARLTPVLLRQRSHDKASKRQSQLLQAAHVQQRYDMALEQQQQWHMHDAQPVHDAAAALEAPLRRIKKMLPGLHAQASACQLDRADAGLTAVQKVNQMLDSIEADLAAIASTATKQPAALRTPVAPAPPEPAAAKRSVIQHMSALTATSPGEAANAFLRSVMHQQRAAERMARGGHSSMAPLSWLASQASDDTPSQVMTTRAGYGRRRTDGPQGQLRNPPESPKP